MVSAFAVLFKTSVVSSRQIGSRTARWREKTYMILSMKMLEGIGMSVA